ncbi:MAG: hypothetical protein JO125_08570, partial [Chloroflexi bacterium]|nr:hypothetical protein [Chloroflexota bacterium]
MPDIRYVCLSDMHLKCACPYNHRICYNNGIMMKKLRGRNLAHFGCLLGITVGLTLGIIIAGVLASVFNVALNTVLFVWFGLTFGLGA